MSKDDAISRKWLLDSKRTVYITDRFDGRTSAYISKKTVEDAPSVTPKSGRWKVHKNYYECSNCESQISNEFFVNYRFCPHCGAKMESEE